MPLNALMDDNTLSKEWLISVLTGDLIFRYQRRNTTKYGNDPLLIVDQFGNATQQRLLMRVMVQSITVMTGVFIE
jgi:hypothetical protein